MGRGNLNFSKGFAKQEMIKRAISGCLDVYDILGNRTDNINPPGLCKIEDKLNGLMEGTVKDAERQEKQYIKAKSKMYVLRLIQIKRRKKLLEWFENYLRKIEDNENNKLIRKYAFGLEREYKDEIRNSFLDEFEDYTNILEELNKVCYYVEAITKEDPSVTCTEGDKVEQEETAEEGEPTEETSSTEDGEEEEAASGAEAGVFALSAEGDGSEEPTPQSNAKKKQTKLEAFFAEGEDCEDADEEG